MAEVYSGKVIALRCSLCGKVECHPLTLFSFSGTHNYRVHCSCGFRKAVISMIDSNRFYIQVPCILCGTEHIFAYTAKEIWGSTLEAISCPESEAELGYFGQDGQVKEAVQKWQENDAGGFEDYFENPPLMFDILNQLHDLAEGHKLFCGCGSQEIEVDLFPEFLELHCSRCQSTCRIDAVTEKDKEFLNNKSVLVINRKDSRHQPGANFTTLYRLK